jgi:hypothetical protein
MIWKPWRRVLAASAVSLLGIGASEAKSIGGPEEINVNQSGPSANGPKLAQAKQMRTQQPAQSSQRMPTTSTKPAKGGLSECGTPAEQRAMRSRSS